MMSSPQPLNVVIIGAGIGGLTAALAFRRSGHVVNIYEKSHFMQEVGAAITVPPNVYPLLKRLEFDPEEHGAVKQQYFKGFTSQGKNLWESPMSVPDRGSPRLIHRVDLHDGLRKAAEKAGAKIHLGNPATGVDAQAGEVTFKDGRKVRGDVVICADGVHSTIRKVLEPDAGVEKPFGCSAFRMLVPADKVRGNKKVRERFAHMDGLITYFADGQRMLLTYPCRSGTLLNVVALFNESITDPVTSDQNLKTRMLDIYSDFHEDTLEVLRLADEVMIWQLLDLPSFQKWSHGKVTLLGDAAHPILPFSAQGGAQSIEDAITLSVLFPFGAKPEDVASRLKLYNDIRSERTAWVQAFGRGEGRVPKGESLKSIMPHAEFFKKAFQHDAWSVAEEARVKAFGE